MVSKKYIEFENIDISNIISVLLLLDRRFPLFYSFRNQDKKYWLIPEKNMKTGLSIYQPSSLKGRVVKIIFPLFKNVKFIQYITGTKIFNCKLNSNLLSLLEHLFGTSELEFSLFGGTPSIHRKVIIQVFKGNKILAYCKVTTSEEIKKLFINEYLLINHLHDIGIENVPKGLYYGSLNDNLDVFIQSTTKSSMSQNIHSWSILHWNFLQNLMEKTVQFLPFEQTDFYESLSKLSSRIKYLHDIDTSVLLATTNKILNSFSEKEVAFSVYHGDFTPWNCYVEKGRIFVFDLEYAKRTYPPYLDWFHFFTQVALFKHKANATEIFEMFKKKSKDLISFFDDPVLMYKCYLLDIISFYLHREKDNLTGDVKKNMIIWVELLTLL